MRRKVIQLAGKTMVVSLPSKWVKRCNVKKGDEVEVEERGREILLKTQSEPEAKRIEFDTRGQNERAIRLFISGLHRRGFDEMELIYDKQETIQLIHDLIKDFFIGFVIINQTKNRCVIKSISKDSGGEFDNSLRRAFLVTITLGENIVGSLKSKDFALLRTTMDLEKTNNQLTGFCERLLNKGGYKEPEKTCFYYIIAWNLEKICDDYKYICDVLLEKGGKKILIGNEVVSFFEEALDYLKKYYNAFYKFDHESVSALITEGERLIEEGRLIIGNKNKYETNVMSIVISQVTKIIDFISSTIPINIQ